MCALLSRYLADGISASGIRPVGMGGTVVCNKRLNIWVQYERKHLKILGKSESRMTVTGIHCRCFILSWLLTWVIKLLYF